jgi:glycosyltransferase involved in cell wall biosynthesis
MLISLNTKIKDGPYGGGMNFLKSLKKFLITKGHKVIHHLDQKNIDIILIANTIIFDTSNYSHIEAFNYKKKNPQTKIFFRVNECDSRKNTNYMDDLIFSTSKYADHIIFISSWLKNYFEKKYKFKKKENFVILNGGDSKIFKNNYKQIHNKDNQKKILVTHHWGAHWKKGFDIYKLLDQKIFQDEQFSKKFEFHYIGNLPVNFKFRSTKVIKPLNGNKLARKLADCDIYLTASINEPAGMHHIEGALCGLPLLFRQSGALNEYCVNFGVSFNEKNFFQRLDYLSRNYECFKKKIIAYPHDHKKMCSEYLNLFINTKNNINNNKKLFLRNNFFAKFFWKIRRKINF